MVRQIVHFEDTQAARPAHQRPAGHAVSGGGAFCVDVGRPPLLAVLRLASLAGWRVPVVGRIPVMMAGCGVVSLRLAAGEQRGEGVALGSAVLRPGVARGAEVGIGIR